MSGSSRCWIYGAAADVCTDSWHSRNFVGHRHVPVHCGCRLVAQAGSNLVLYNARYESSRPVTHGCAIIWQTSYFRNAAENREKGPDFRPSGGRVIFSLTSGDSRPNREGWRVCEMRLLCATVRLRSE